jgi:uncharacterized protein YyaL (SSP411 family)
MVVDGRLRHASRHGQAKAPATASDYANMIWAALRLHEATNEAAYFTQAVAWCDVLDRHYWMEGQGGYATSADDTDDVIVRMRPGTDDATPNANAVMLSNLAALGVLTGEARYLERASALMSAFAGDIGRNIVAHTGMLAGAIDVMAPQIVAIVGKSLEGSQALMDAISTISLPGALQYCMEPDVSNLAALRDKQPVNRRATAYACLGPQCSPPLTETNEFVRTLKAQRSVS